ncbi:hypothetical protein IAU59_000726 [Kwoniella sp. CBS 9459]
MQDISNGLESVPIPVRKVPDDHLQAVLGPFSTYITDSVLPDSTPISDTVGQPPIPGNNEIGYRDAAETTAEADIPSQYDSNSSESSGSSESGSESHCAFFPSDDSNTEEDQDQDRPWTCTCSADETNVDDTKWLCTVVNGESCDCVSSFGNFYSPPSPSSGDQITRHHQTLNLYALPEELPLVECSPACPCAERCANRLTQGGVRAPLAIQPSSSGVGLGLFYSPSTDTSIYAALQKGSFISLYAGEYLTTRQARERWTAQQQRDLSSDGQGNYILSLKLQGQVIHIDPRYKGNVGRFLNHSCDPNCVIHPVKWGADNAWYRAAIFTKRDIQSGEELTFDYANASGSAIQLNRLNQDQEEEHLTRVNRQRKGEEQEGCSSRVRCLCGSEKCRGWMPFDETL